MKKVILDVDTGSDDAIAIMTAAADPTLDIVAICTVHGNKPLEYTTENTLRVLDILQKDYPVYPGCPSSIIKHLNPNRKKVKTAPKPHDNKSGVMVHVDYIGERPSQRKPNAENAVQFYIDYLSHATEKTTVILLGPQTNLALALTIRPEISQNIEEIIIMGGGLYKSNATIAAEFNIYQDPEAAQIIAESGCKLTYVPLDATHQACIDSKGIAALRELGTAAGKVAAELAETMLQAYQIIQPMKDENSVPLHDALAVCYAINPAVLQNILHTRVDIDCSGGYADGQTVVDTRPFTDKPRNAWFALGADESLFRQMVFDHIASLL